MLLNVAKLLNEMWHFSNTATTNGKVQLACVVNEFFAEHKAQQVLNFDATSWPFVPHLVPHFKSLLFLLLKKRGQRGVKNGSYLTTTNFIDPSNKIFFYSSSRVAQNRSHLFLNFEKIDFGF